eukprot:scaffold191271_cov48-Attheya_sp.AAC.1
MSRIFSLSMRLVQGVPTLVSFCNLEHDLDKGLTPLTVFFPNAPTKAHRKRNVAREEMVKLFSK